jgi:tetratricopeptide (TPR) repeat protein
MTTLMQPETTPTTKPDGISERTLSRLVKWGAGLLALLLVAFGAVYFLGQRGSSAPSLAERQVSAAEELVTKEPQNVQNRLKLAATYQTVGRLDDAVAQFDEVLKAVPTNSTALLGLGSVMIDKGDLDAAKTALTKLTAGAKKVEFSSVDPQTEAAYYWLGSIALKQNDPATAITQLSAALTIDKSDADAWYLLGTAQSQKGDDKVAIQSLMRALLFVPTGWCEPYVALNASYGKLSKNELAEYAGAMVDFCNKKPDVAAQRLQALTTGPAAVPSLLGLGLIAETTSDRTAAAGWYQKVLKAEPGNATALTALGRLNVKPATASNAAKKTATSSTSTSTQGKAS